MIQTIIPLSGNYLRKVLVTGMSLNEIQSKAADPRMKTGLLIEEGSIFPVRFRDSDNKIMI